MRTGKALGVSWALLLCVGFAAWADGERRLDPPESPVPGGRKTILAQGKSKPEKPTEDAGKAGPRTGKEEVDAAVAEMLKDPAKHYDEILILQRAHLKMISEKLGLRFTVLETEHYMMNSTMKPSVAKQVGNGCEDLYKKMSKAFGVQKGDMLWAGKCVVHLLDNREQFIDFAVKIDGFDGGDAQNAGGYFSHEGRFVHIVIPRMEGGEKSFESTLIHEGAHAFLQLYKDDVFIYPWIHEGVAQYFENRAFPSNPEWGYKRDLVRTAYMSLTSLRSAKSFMGMSGADMMKYYAFAWSALDFMIRANPQKFVKFIHALKEGKSEEDAIQEAFGKSMAEFEQAWRAYAKKSF